MPTPRRARGQRRACGERLPGRGGTETTGTDEWSARHPLAAELEELAPGVGLAAVLAAVLAGASVDDADGTTLVEMVVGWEHIISWATASQARAVAALADRCPGGRALDSAADEVASALAVSRRAGQNKVDLALDLRAAPRVGDALGAGTIAVRKAQAMLPDTDHLDADAAAQALDAALDRAADLTVPQLRAFIRRAELALDPQGAEKRHTAACTERGVRLIPAPDAMAWISAFLPADDALTVLTAVDQRRADALVDVCRDVLDTGIGPRGVPVPTRQHRRPHLAVTVPEHVLSGARDGFGDLAGYGAIPGGIARRIAAQADWTTVAIDGRTGEALSRSKAYRPSPSLVMAVLDRDVTCTFPGCRVPAPRCDIDHVEPFRPDRPPELQTRLDNLKPLCRHHHRLKTHGRWTASRDPVAGVTTWPSPMGFTYTRDPVPAEPSFPSLERAPRPRMDAHGKALREPAQRSR